MHTLNIWQFYIVNYTSIKLKFFKKVWAPEKQDCLAIVKTVLPSEERNFSFLQPSLFMHCAVFAWIVFTPLPLGEEAGVYDLVSLKLITLRADKSTELEEEIKGLWLTLRPRGEMCGAGSIQLTSASCLLRQCKGHPTLHASLAQEECWKLFLLSCFFLFFLYVCYSFEGLPFGASATLRTTHVYGLRLFTFKIQLLMWDQR